VLSEIAGVLKASIRGSDAVVRYGGDEFLIMLTDTTSFGAANVINRILKQLNDWNRAAHPDNVPVYLSSGKAEWKDWDTLDEMLDRADRLMYEEKDS
jgi:diguanylate cyclase (GGDEF)-like protein